MPVVGSIVGSLVGLKEGLLVDGIMLGDTDVNTDGR